MASIDESHLYRLDIGFDCRIAPAPADGGTMVPDGRHEHAIVNEIVLEEERNEFFRIFWT